jgi:2-(1,2-epoxy-1,2-dihydrophenyl)acetyl-CoA isomerase
LTSYSQILVEQRGDVLLITLNRPEKLNAWTRTLNRELEDAIRGANENPDVGAIVITGAGRGFCAGADIGESFQAPLQADERPALNGGAEPGESRWVELIRESKPIVAAINGVAVGVGITMMLPVDIIIASDRARIGMFFVRMGLVPELASSHFLVQRVGRGPYPARGVTRALSPVAIRANRRTRSGSTASINDRRMP